FKNERTRPVHDLIGHIDLDAPGRILDIGCGPGNSSAVLAERYPGSEIIGLDSSPAMIERAKKECLKARFLTEDGSKDLSHLGKFDLIFANASLQWMPDHARLLRGYVKMLQKGGAIAMQIPEFLQMPAAKILAGAAASLQFAGFFRDFDPGLHENPPRILLQRAKPRQHASQPVGDLLLPRSARLRRNHGVALIDRDEALP
ncbi:MAG TPA: methyltransferase domain-containing protein, partial [Clostridia bacterium]|nr:methyltransferase domain-containing protein [Clostridia bacterium]